MKRSPFELVQHTLDHRSAGVAFIIVNCLALSEENLLLSKQLRGLAGFPEQQEVWLLTFNILFIENLNPLLYWIRLFRRALSHYCQPRHYPRFQILNARRPFIACVVIAGESNKASSGPTRGYANSVPVTNGQGSPDLFARYTTGYPPTCILCKQRWMCTGQCTPHHRRFNSHAPFRTGHKNSLAQHQLEMQRP